MSHAELPRAVLRRSSIRAVFQSLTLRIGVAGAQGSAQFEGVPAGSDGYSSGFGLTAEPHIAVETLTSPPPPPPPPTQHSCRCARAPTAAKLFSYPIQGCCSHWTLQSVSVRANHSVLLQVTDLSRHAMLENGPRFAVCFSCVLCCLWGKGSQPWGSRG